MGPERGEAHGNVVVVAQRFGRVHRAVLLVFPLLAACETSPTGTAEGTVSSTVALGGARSLFLETLVPLELRARRGDIVELELMAVVTASSAALAEQIVNAYAFETDLESRPDAAIIRTPEPERGSLSGRLTVRAPFDLDLEVRSRRGPLTIEGFEGAVAVEASDAVSVLDAEGDVVLRVSTGAVLVDVDARAGDRIDIGVGTGNIEVQLPSPLDANVDVSAPGGVESDHPNLPSRPGGSRYFVRSGIGLASVVATTGRGTVFFTTRGP